MERKLLVWLGSTRDEVRAFPDDARRTAGEALFRVECGTDPLNWKPMKTIGSGVREIRIKEASGAFRVIYLATRGDKVYVLHAFQKKTEKTTLHDLRLAQERFKNIED